jgi:hypothetical protein
VFFLQDGTVVEQALEVDGRSWAMTCVSMGNPHAVTYSVDGQPIKVRSARGQGCLELQRLSDLHCLLMFPAIVIALVHICSGASSKAVSGAVRWWNPTVFNRNAA